MDTQCPNCNNPVRLSDDAMGKKAKCGACGHVWQLIPNTKSLAWWQNGRLISFMAIAAFIGVILCTALYTKNNHLKSKLLDLNQISESDPEDINELPEEERLNELVIQKNAEIERLKNEKEKFELNGPTYSQLTGWILNRINQDELNEDFKKGINSYLKGIEGYSLLIRGIDKECPLSREELERTVEFEFRKAGVKVINPRKNLKGNYGLPECELNLNLIKGTDEFYLYDINFEITRSSFILEWSSDFAAEAEVYEQGYLGSSVGKYNAKEHIKKFAIELTQEFLNEHLKANPKN